MSLYAILESVLLIAALLGLAGLWFMPSRYMNPGLVGLLLLLPALFLFVDGDRSWALLGFVIIGATSLVYWLIRRYAKR